MMPKFPDVLRPTYHRNPVIYRYLSSLKTPLSISARTIPETDNKPNRTLTRLLLILVSVLALSGCGVGESNQEAELKSRYCEIPSNGNSGLNLQANSAGTFLTVKVQPSNDLQQMAEGIVYVDTSPEKLQLLKALDLSKEYWIRQFPDVDNIGIWCNYITRIIGKGAEARELPFLKSFSVVTYKNGQYIVLAELLVN